MVSLPVLRKTNQSQPVLTTYHCEGKYSNLEVSFAAFLLWYNIIIE